LEYLRETAARFQCDLSRRIQGLSLGINRNWACCRLLCTKPELLILDEPTNGLDPLMQMNFYDFTDETTEEAAPIFLSCAHLTGSGKGV